VSAYAHQLFSIPGTFSFNLWTAVPTPTLQNATLWNKMLDSHAQNLIIARLEDDQNTVIIRRINVMFDGELGTYIQRNFEPAFGVDNYEFLVHRGRRVAPLSTARIRSDPLDPNYSLLSITLAQISSPITSVEIWQSGTSTLLIPDWVGRFMEPPGRLFLAR